MPYGNKKIIIDSFSQKAFPANNILNAENISKLYLNLLVMRDKDLQDAINSSVIYKNVILNILSSSATTGEKLVMCLYVVNLNEKTVYWAKNVQIESHYIKNINNKGIVYFFTNDILSKSDAYIKIKTFVQEYIDKEHIKNQEPSIWTDYPQEHEEDVILAMRKYLSNDIDNKEILYDLFVKQINQNALIPGYISKLKKEFSKLDKCISAHFNVIRFLKIETNNIERKDLMILNYILVKLTWETKDYQRALKEINTDAVLNSAFNLKSLVEQQKEEISDIYFMYLLNSVVEQRKLLLLDIDISFSSFDSNAFLSLDSQILNQFNINKNKFSFSNLDIIKNYDKALAHNIHSVGALFALKYINIFQGALIMLESQHNNQTDLVNLNDIKQHIQNLQAAVDNITVPELYVKKDYKIENYYVASKDLETISQIGNVISSKINLFLQKNYLTFLDQSLTAILNKLKDSPDIIIALTEGKRIFKETCIKVEEQIKYAIKYNIVNEENGKEDIKLVQNLCLDRDNIFTNVLKIYTEKKNQAEKALKNLLSQKTFLDQIVEISTICKKANGYLAVLQKYNQEEIEQYIDKDIVDLDQKKVSIVNMQDYLDTYSTFTEKEAQNILMANLKLNQNDKSFLEVVQTMQDNNKEEMACPYYTAEYYTNINTICKMNSILCDLFDPYQIDTQMIEDL